MEASSSPDFIMKLQQDNNTLYLNFQLKLSKTFTINDFENYVIINYLEYIKNLKMLNKKAKFLLILFNKDLILKIKDYKESKIIDFKFEENQDYLTRIMRTNNNTTYFETIYANEEKNYLDEEILIIIMNPNFVDKFVSLKILFD